MIDIASMAALASSLKTAGDITKTAVGLRDAQALQSKVIELNEVILSAQSSAIAANVAQTTLVQRVGELEKRVAELEAWDAEKQRYELYRHANGALTYTLKEGMQGTEPAHEICATCYSNGHKGFLKTEFWQPLRCEVRVCHDCGSVVYVKGGPHPDHKSFRPTARR